MFCKVDIFGLRQIADIHIALQLSPPIFTGKFQSCCLRVFAKTRFLLCASVKMLASILTSGLEQTGMRRPRCGEALAGAPRGTSEEGSIFIGGHPEIKKKYEYGEEGRREELATLRGGRIDDVEEVHMRNINLVN